MSTEDTSLHTYPLLQTIALDGSPLPSFAACEPCMFDATTHKVYRVQIPDAGLHHLPRVLIRDAEDLKAIPCTGGNYWILTDEPIHHCLNRASKHPPVSNTGTLRVVYNGVSSESLQGRAKEHLLREDAKGGFGSMSGISVDLQRTPATTKVSHAKCMWHTEPKKIPGFLTTPHRLTDREAVLATIHLSEAERAWIATQPADAPLYFKNGIDVRNDKHQPYTWYFVFAALDNHSLRDYVEIEWRRRYGLPILCSYMSGR